MYTQKHNQRVVFFDVDNTLVRGQSQRLFISFLLKRRLVSLWAYLKIIFWFFLYKIGIAKNPRAIAEYGFAFLKGYTLAEFEKIVNVFFNTVLRDRIYRKAEEIIKKHKEKGDKVILLSNSFNTLMQRLTDFLLIDGFLCTNLEIVDGKFTGKIDGDIVYGVNKTNLAKQYLKDNHISRDYVWAYADHISDLGILTLAGNPVVVNPSSALLKEARIRKWKILLYNK